MVGILTGLDIPVDEDVVLDISDNLAAGLLDVLLNR